MTIARWLPPVVRAEPEPGAPRLLDVLLAAVDGQVAALHEDLDRLWDDLFVESCADWAVPYLGALLGLPPDAGRREVAYAVALRRRKGTPAALEDFGFVVTGLTVRVLEGWQTTVWAQRPGHPPPLRTAVAAPGDRVARARFGGPFETGRRIFTPGRRWHPRAVTAVVWPWQVRTLTDTAAVPLTPPGRFALDPLGGEAPLYLRPRRPRIAAEAGAPATAAETRVGDETDAPVRATYRVLEALGPVEYGPPLALAAGHPLAQAGALIALTVQSGPVPASAIRYGAVPATGVLPAPPAAGQVLVDPDRGHVQLGAGLAGPVRATWCRAFTGPFGALASRAEEHPGARVVVVVNPASATAVPTLAAAFATARTLSAGLDPAGSRDGVPDVEIRLETSDRLAAPPPQAFTPAVPRWRIVAPALVTPTIVGDLGLDLPDGRVELAGFLHAGALRLGDRLAEVTVDGVTQDPAAGGIAVAATAWRLALTVRRSVVGPLRADLGALPVTVTDSVVDGRRRRARPCGGDPQAAPPVAAVDRTSRFAPALVTTAVTFLGPVVAESVAAADTIFADGLDVVQQQEGGARYCYLRPPASGPARWPVTYASGPHPPPRFVADGFGAAGYAALDYTDAGHPLLAAAGDGGEVGAHHAAGRAALIRRFAGRIDEFVPLGLRASVVVADWEER
ncbi:hypothetical protein Drose_13575 [Dactylosporangium roseum]|uniref:Baseplate protein J-like domain-containing protein n=1 Tax=Dactylosporangium roseum TaxID=47989 RepID=A0ABY5ZAW5_9ACTN|nr:phage tail protein [Dactylosporangium roseum]UWZ39161.1 hypothetical protein Drose_13575 [Dactylosporangium roseum]